MVEFAFELVDTAAKKANIKVIGVGGSGGNAIEHMLDKGIEGVDFLCANTDAQDLAQSSVETKIQLGIETTRGLGAGMNPEIGRESAEESKEAISNAIKDSDMLFITAGFGGGTGTGASPIIAEIAKELGILTVGVVTKPFDYEGPSRSEQAEVGIMKLEQHVDSLIVIPNEKLKSLGKTITVLAGFEAANNVLLNSVQGIVELITVPGVINLDFADVKAVMSDKGRGIMGSALASGPDRGRQAVDEAINSPLLEDINLEGAKGILLNVTSGNDLEISELEEIGSMVKGYASKEAKIIVGTSVSQEMNDSIRVTVVATGLEDNEKGEKKSTETNFRNFDRPITERNPLTQTKDLFGNKEEDIVESNKELEILDVPKFLKRQDA
jgi:cell division protein FtsZ